MKTVPFLTAAGLQQLVGTLFQWRECLPQWFSSANRWWQPQQTAAVPAPDWCSPSELSLWHHMQQRLFSIYIYYAIIQENLLPLLSEHKHYTSYTTYHDLYQMRFSIKHSIVCPLCQKQKQNFLELSPPPPVWSIFIINNIIIFM